MPPDPRPEKAASLFLPSAMRPAARCGRPVRLRPILSAVLACALACAPWAAPVRAEEDLAPQTVGLDSREGFRTGTAFFDDADVSGGVYLFRRDRRRYDAERGRYRTNLNHASLQANAEFVSGFAGGWLGFDFGVFGSHDLMNKGAVDHEMGFVPWGDPWHPDWNARSADDGVSVYKAALKLRAGPAWAKAGYFQPTGPGVLGVNWSIMPGTYRGVNVGADVGGLSLAAAWADEYKSPWFVYMNRFRRNDGETVPWLWSAGARYAFGNGLTLEIGYGASKGHLRNAHFKSNWKTSLGKDALTVGYHLYLMDDDDDSGVSENDAFDGEASLQFVFGRYERGPWTFRLEGTYVRAPMSGPQCQGPFAYRLTNLNGSSAGACDVWWDARSDWNADNEKAAFAGVMRTLDDVLPVAGFAAGAGAAFGFDGRGYGTAEHLKEWAFTFDLNYTRPSGPLEGAFARLHYTEYRNGTDQPSWVAYRNAFQSERDLKLLIGIPF